MRVFFIIILFFVSIANTHAQGWRSRFYLPNDSDNLARAIFETSPGNYFTAGFNARLTIVGLNNLGQPTWVKKYGNAKFTYLPNILIRRSFYKQGNFIYHACCVRDSNNNQIGALLKFDGNGDTLWQKIYRDPLEDVIPQMVTGSVDGGFLITGFFQNWVNHTRPCLLIKTDANGNELWRKRIHKPNQDVSNGIAIVQDSATKKIVLAGNMYHSAADSYDHMLILDSLGNNPVRKTYVRAGGVAYDMIQTSDKKMIAVGMDNQGSTLGGNSLMNSYAVKFDINNPNIPIWKVLLDTMTLVNFFACIRELSNGDVLIAGTIDTLKMYNQQANVLIRMTKIDVNGHVKFNRYYNYKINDPVKANNLRLSSLELAADGSWLASIETIHNPKPNPFFFVKFDTTGCDTVPAYCQLNYTTAIQTTTRAPVPPVPPAPVGFSDIANASEGFTIYPNPVNEILNVTCQFALVPKMLNGDYLLELVDSTVKNKSG